MMDLFSLTGNICRRPRASSRFVFSITAGADVVEAFLWGELVNEGADAGPQGFGGSFSGFAQQGFEFGEQFFDRVQVGGVRRQVHDICSDLADGLGHPGLFVAGEVVHHHNVFAFQRRHEELLHVGQKTFAVHRTVEDEWRGQSGTPHGGHKRGGFPVSVGDSSNHTGGFQSPAITTGHLGVGPGFIKKYQPLPRFRLHQNLPPATLFLHVRAQLFSGVLDFFLASISTA